MYACNCMFCQWQSVVRLTTLLSIDQIPLFLMAIFPAGLAEFSACPGEHLRAAQDTHIFGGTLAPGVS
jgi:hypothetical protein